jgi:transcriptional regulator with XRE-family HTH domain
MRPATGTHNLRRLREELRLEQKQFAPVIHLSKSLLQKLENEKRPLSRRQAEDIAACTGISVGWLLRNDRSEPLVDSKGKPYSEERFRLAQAMRFDLMPTLAMPVMLRALLLQSYARTRDLFLRPEMHKHFIKFWGKLEILRSEFELEADYPEEMTARQIIDEDVKKYLDPDVLYPGIIRDAEKCHKAEKLQRKRLAREEAEKAKRIAQLSSPPKDKGLRTIRKRILQSVTAPKK